MAMKERELVRSRCKLCRRLYDPKGGFKNIKDTCFPASKKSVKDVLVHLAKCIKEEVILQDLSYVCGPCYEKLDEYDQIMLQLLTHQKELSHLLQTSINALDSYDEEEATNESINSDDSNSEEDIPNQDSCAIPNYNCSACAQRLKSRASLRKHLDAHAKAKRCPICGVLRRDEEYLELHMNVHEGKSENECRYCPKQYSRRAHVIRHMHLHWDKKKFQCEKCGVRFSQSQQLYNHKMHHDAEENPLVCGECGQTFKSNKTFKHHMLTHQEDRPMYPCEMCGKKFSEKYTLKIHLKTHQGTHEEEHSQTKKRRAEKEFPCIICQMVLSSKDVLESHMVDEHDVIKPFVASA